MLLNFLLVDDSSTFRGMIEKTLRIAGIPLGKVFHASDGKEALSVLESEWVDFVFVDVHMPVMNGSELVERMSTDSVLSNIPVVLLTTEGSSMRVEKMKEQGVRAYLRKPCSPEAVGEVVLGIVGGEDLRLETVIKRVFPDVIQNLAYMFCDRLEKEEAKAVGNDLLRAGMIFTGGMNGEMSLLASKGICDRIACNILGSDSRAQSSPESARDAIREVLNVTCGHILTSIAGEKAPMELSTTEVGECEVADWEKAREAQNAYAFRLEDESVLFVVEVEGATP